jgi:hypothetical protein
MTNEKKVSFELENMVQTHTKREREHIDASSAKRKIQYRKQETYKWGGKENLGKRVRE